MTLSHKGRYS